MTLQISVLDSKIKSIEGRDVADLTGELITFRSAFVAACGAYQPFAVNNSSFAAGSEAVQSYLIGKKIFETKEDLELTESEITLLKKIVDSNKVFFAFITAQLLELLNDGRQHNGTD